MRQAVVEVFEAATDEQAELEEERGRLLLRVPELRARMLMQIADSVTLLAEQVAARVGRDPDDFEVRNLTGAVVGVMMSVVLRMADRAEPGYTGYVELLGAALDHLERGLPL
jgi:hypothetical protein